MRITLTLVGIAAIFFGPAWVGMLCMVLLSIRWSAWEVILMGALIDILWQPSTYAHGIPVATLLSIALVWVLLPLRAQLLIGGTRQRSI